MLHQLVKDSKKGGGDMAAKLLLSLYAHKHLTKEEVQALAIKQNGFGNNILQININHNSKANTDKRVDHLVALTETLVKILGEDAAIAVILQQNNKHLNTVHLLAKKAHGGEDTAKYLARIQEQGLISKENIRKIAMSRAGENRNANTLDQTIFEAHKNNFQEQYKQLMAFNQEIAKIDPDLPSLIAEQKNDDIGKNIMDTIKEQQNKLDDRKKDA